MDWQIAENYLCQLEAAYKALVGMPRVNPSFAIGILSGLRTRFENGERTQELHDAIMGMK